MNSNIGVRRAGSARLTTQLILVGTALLALPACSGSAGNGPSSRAVGSAVVVSPPTVAVIPSRTTITGLVLPLQTYMPTAAQTNIINTATAKEITACMRTYGFDYPPLTDPVSDVNQLRRAYGVVDLAAARQYGYHLAPGDPGFGENDASKRRQAAIANHTKPLPAAEVLVLDGPDASSSGQRYNGKSVPAGGCGKIARQKVTGVDEIDPTDLAFNLMVSLDKKAQADPRVVKAFSAWSSCMHDSGYDYPTPLAAIADKKWSAATPTTAEIATATTDVQCKQRTNLIGIWFSVDEGYEREAIQQQIQQLTAVKQRWDEGAKQAARLLGVPAPQHS